MDIVTIVTGQNGYTPTQVADNAVSVSELIAQLQDYAENYGDDMPVVIRGYGNGAVFEPVRFVDIFDSEDY